MRKAIRGFPFVPYTDKAFLKLLKVEPISGTFVTLLKAPCDLVLPKHHHCGTVMVYTIKGQVEVPRARLDRGSG